MLFLIVACACIVCLGAHQLLFLYTNHKRQRSAEWNTLLASIEAVNFEGIHAIADLFLSPSRDQLSLEPFVIWEMLGGLEGLMSMRQNAATMLNLCIYAERWGQEGELIAQLIRTDALYLNRAVRRIEWAVWFGLGKRRSHFALLEAAAYYELIQRRLCGLYENTHIALLPALEARLKP